MDRALLGAEPVGRIGLLAPLGRGHHRALSGHDHEEDVGDHDGAEHRPEVHVGAAAAEDGAERPGDGGQRDDEDAGHQVLVPPEFRAAQRIVAEPAADEGQHAETDRDGLGQRHHVRVDQVDLGLVPVDQREQEGAGDQRGVGLPLEPVQVGGHGRHAVGVLLGVVEAAAVHRPELAADAALAGGVGRRLEVVVEPDEIERGPDPGDAGDEVGPASEQAEPFDDVAFHEVGLSRQRAAVRVPPDCKRRSAIVRSGDARYRSGQAARRAGERSDGDERGDRDERDERAVRRRAGEGSLPGSSRPWPGKLPAGGRARLRRRRAAALPERARPRPGRRRAASDPCGAEEQDVDRQMSLEPR